MRISVPSAFAAASAAFLRTGATCIGLVLCSSVAVHAEAPAIAPLDPAVAMAPAAPAPARAGKASIAVVPFQASADISQAYASDLDLLYDSLVRILVKTNKFDVLERTKIDSVIDENHFATSSLGDPANLTQFGKLTGAQYLLVGTIRDLGVNVHREEIPYTTEVKCTESAHLRFEVRVVQAQTGRIVSAESAGDSKDPGIRTVSCGRTRQTVLDDTMARVSANLVANIVDNIYPLTIVHVTGDELTLNRGEGSAFSVGATLECFTRGEAIIDPDTGEKLGSDETAVGKITVTQILDKLSKARAEVAGTGMPVGAICRVLVSEARPKPVASRPKPAVSW
jgi:curli biogenesis system outer membrane secretion channel CsgG